MRWLTLFGLCLVPFAAIGGDASSITTGISDEAFVSCLQGLAKRRSWKTPEDVDEIKCHNQSIKTVEGISRFTRLTSLSLYKNHLTHFDASGFTYLQHLNLAGNRLSTLDVSDAPSLKALYAFHNELTHLTVQRCEKLISLKANNNQLVQTHLAGLPKLGKVYLFDNQMESLDIEELAGLKYLDVRHNPMPDDFYDYLDTIEGLTALHDGNAEDWD